MDCHLGRLNVGKVRLCHMSRYQERQFIDYIYGGCDISAMVAMDCTIANGDPSQPTSLHYLPQMKMVNAEVSDSASGVSRPSKSDAKRK